MALFWSRRSGIERRIVRTHQRIRQLEEDLRVLDEQWDSFSSDEQDAHVRMLVSDSSADRRNWREASGHAGLVERQRVQVRAKITELRRVENDLLAKLVV